MNKVFLIGRLTRDCETKYSQSGKAWVSTAIAVDRRTKDETADFFNLVAWEKTAEIMGKYLKKGNKILVDGHLQFNQYEDKDGNKKSSVNVIVENFEFLDNKDKSKSKGKSDTDPNNPGFDPNDMPF